jgi:hypothetical protein
MMQAVEKLPILKMRRSLSAADGDLFRAPKWLTDSYEDPAGFWHRYLDVFSQHGGVASHARYDEGYDFYHDLVTRYQDDTALAFIHWHANRGVERLSYQNLHARCRALECAWREAGVNAGDALAIVLPIGVNYVVSLLTALKMGLCFVSVPMLGNRFAQGCIDQGHLDWWVTEDRYLHGLEVEAERLPLSCHDLGSGGGADRSYFYEATEVVGSVFSPVQDLQDGPVEVSAQTLFLGLIRDAAIGLSLDRGDVIAAPGFCPIQFQPTILLTTLAAGATFVEFSETQAQAQTPELEQFGFTHLLLQPLTRDALVRNQLAAVPKLKRWFRNAHGALDWNRWDQFSKLAKSQSCLGSTYFANAAAGGAIMTGVSRLQPKYMHVLPMPGSGFTMADANLSGMPTVTESGVLEWSEYSNSDLLIGHQLVSRDRNEFVLIGPVRPHREGQSYTGEAVTNLVESHPGVTHARVVFAPAASAGSGWRAIVVVFVEPDGDWFNDRKSLATALSLQCKVELGLRAVPNKIEVFGQVPHHEDGEISQAWCDGQYLTGMLHRKEQVEVFRDLSSLRFAAGQLTLQRQAEG